MKIRDRIIVAESERGIINLLCSVLKANDYDVVVVSTGKDALSLISSHCPDLVVLDPELPDMEGIGLLRSLREWSTVPVIVISSSDQEKDKVDMLDAGADDYITKPFGTSEFLARVRSALRHRWLLIDGKPPASNGLFRTGSLEIDYSKHRVFVDGRDAGLTNIEYRIVSLLSRHAGRILTYEMIIREIWGPNLQRDNRILRVNMSNIRRKIEKDPSFPEYIFTEAGVGYYLREAD